VRHTRFQGHLSYTDNSTNLAFFISDPPRSINTPSSLHPPELVFRLALTKAVDIWNLGSTVSTEYTELFKSLIMARSKTYELVTGRSLFEAGVDATVLIPQFQTAIGGVPEQWVTEAVSKGLLGEGFNGMYTGTSRTTVITNLKSILGRGFLAAR
jgi:hypothetical protein